MDSYYTRFPGRKVWAQGDFIYQDTTTKGLEILGRSDGVLNPVRTSPLPPSPFFFLVSTFCIYEVVYTHPPKLALFVALGMDRMWLERCPFRLERSVQRCGKV